MMFNSNERFQCQTIMQKIPKVRQLQTVKVTDMTDDKTTSYLNNNNNKNNIIKQYVSLMALKTVLKIV